MSIKKDDILYIEVKCTTCNEIYFSKNEIIFAYKHFENYEVKIVNNNEIFDIDMIKNIEDIYNTITDNNNNWSIETVKFKIEFL